MFKNFGRNMGKVFVLCVCNMVSISRYESSADVLKQAIEDQKKAKLAAEEQKKSSAEDQRKAAAALEARKTQKLNELNASLVLLIGQIPGLGVTANYSYVPGSEYTRDRGSWETSDYRLNAIKTDGFTFDGEFKCNYDGRILKFPASKKIEKLITSDTTINEKKYNLTDLIDPTEYQNDLAGVTRFFCALVERNKSKIKLLYDVLIGELRKQFNIHFDITLEEALDVIVGEIEADKIEERREQKDKQQRREAAARQAQQAREAEAKRIKDEIHAQNNAYSDFCNQIKGNLKQIVSEITFATLRTPTNFSEKIGEAIGYLDDRQRVNNINEKDEKLKGMKNKYLEDQKRMLNPFKRDFDRLGRLESSETVITQLKGSYGLT